MLQKSLCGRGLTHATVFLLDHESECLPLNVMPQATLLALPLSGTLVQTEAGPMDEVTEVTPQVGALATGDGEK